MTGHHVGIHIYRKICSQSLFKKTDQKCIISYNYLYDASNYQQQVVNYS